MRRTNDATDCAPAFERRAERARALCASAPAAAETLAFAAGLCREQGRSAAELTRIHATTPLSGDLAADAEHLLAGAEGVLRYAAESGPMELANTARARLADDAATARARLLTYWHGDLATEEDYLSRALLRPYVEFLRSAGVAPDRARGNGACPFCGGRPWIAARRDGSALEGARRLLDCALCGGEWPIGRILCACCAEADPRALPVFSSDRHPGARLEACERCLRYVKSIDVAADGGAIPEIDDLASLALDLWAREQGFRRLELGLAGL